MIFAVEAARHERVVRRLRIALLASSALCAALPAAALDATWLLAPGSGDFNTAANWAPAAVPTGTASFGTSGVTALSLSASTTVGGWTFNAGASAYTFATNGQTLQITGAGIIINGGSAGITNTGGNLIFSSASTAGSASITNNATVQFLGTSTAGSATITNNNNYLFFGDTATAGSASITNNASLYFVDASTAGSASITNTSTGLVFFNGTNTAGSATIANAGRIYFNGASTGGSAAFTNSAPGAVVDFGHSLNNLSAGSLDGGGTFSLGHAELTVGGNNLSTNVTGVIADGGAGGGTGAKLIKTGTGTMILSGINTYTGATTVNGGTLAISGSIASGTITNSAALVYFGAATAGSATITNNNALFFSNTSTAGSATIANNSGGGLVFSNTSTAGSASITNNSGGVINFRDSSTAGGAGITNNDFLKFFETSTAGSATITNNNALFFSNTSTAGNAAIVNGASGTTDFSESTGLLNDNKLSAGSLNGGGFFRLGQNELTVGGNNLSTNVTGVIADGGAGGGTGAKLIKIGTGTMILSGINTYTGATTVNGGVLAVNGSTASSSLMTVNAGGTLGGNGIVGNTIIDGGTLAPGNSIGLLTVQGSLVFTAASSYMVEVSPANADRTNVTGAATLGGATVNASFAAGTYVVKQYTILNAAGGLGGSTFGSVVNTNLPGGFKTSLSYDANNAYLNLEIALAQYSGLGVNQQNVANTLSNFFNSTGGIPLVFGTLTPAGLTQVSGEAATGSQQTTFDAMNQFMGVMTDPFIAGRGDPISGGGNPNAYADEESLAYAAHDKSRTKSERDAYAAIYTKAPSLAPSFAQRWSVWAAGFGGSQTTDGNTVVGSNNTRSSIYAGAVGADYRLSPNTIAGFALAGGGTNFSVNGFGSGRSDLFQAGAFIRHNVGAAYLSGALAYGWQDITTDRTVTVAGVDRLRAQFNANAWSGRVEGGYRFLAQGFGLTPYAAGQFTTFELPNYAEQVIVGANTFALAYNSRSVADTRSELGLRSDKSFAMPNGIFTLRGRAAWAHDFNPDRAIGATFQTLPGASFVVNGAARAADAALVTGAAEMKWINGWSAAATFEGEFSQVTRSYAGKGVVRYSW